MAGEAFVWFYRDGEPLDLPMAEVLNAFEVAVSRWEPETGRLQLDFGSSADGCDVFLDPAAAQRGKARGLLISRPTQAQGLWEAIFRLMSAHSGLLFFSDDTTPLVCNLAAVAHYPNDLIRELGNPLLVGAPGEIISRRSGSQGG